MRRTIAAGAQAGLTWCPRMKTHAPRYGLACAALASLLVGTASAEGAEPGPDTAPINVIAVQTSSADSQAEALTRTLQGALALVDVRVLDHVVVGAGRTLSMAQKGLL